MPVVRYSFTLDAVKNANLVRRLGLETSTTEAIRRALDAYYNRPSHQDITAKLDEVLDCLRGVKVVNVGNQAPNEATEAEPATARRGLDAMRKRFREKRLDS